jgi:hypothetical protein
MSTGGRGPLQTQHAIQATELAAACNDALKKVRIEPGAYAVQMTAPEGPSTAGGIQAMQHLKLVPGAAGYPTLVFGHANHAEGRAELRTYEHLDAIHRQRFKRPLVLDRARYDECLALAQHVLDALHLQTSITGPPADLPEEPLSGPRERGRSRIAVAIIVAIALAAAALAIWTLLREGRS